jgi:hypothetical protein
MIGEPLSLGAVQIRVFCDEETTTWRFSTFDGLPAGAAYASGIADGNAIDKAPLISITAKTIPRNFVRFLSPNGDCIFRILEM